MMGGGGACAVLGPYPRMGGALHNLSMECQTWCQLAAGWFREWVVPCTTCLRGACAVLWPTREWVVPCSSIM